MHFGAPWICFWQRAACDETDMVQSTKSFADFYAAVGEANAAWAIVDVELQGNFNQLVARSITGSGSAAIDPDGLWLLHELFHARADFGDRLRLIERILSRLVGEGILAEQWAVLERRASRLHDRKRLLSNGLVQGCGDHATVIGLLAPRGDRRCALTYRQVCAQTLLFEAFAERLVAFADIIGRSLYLNEPGARRGASGA